MYQNLWWFLHHQTDFTFPDSHLKQDILRQTVERIVAKFTFFPRITFKTSMEELARKFFMQIKTFVTFGTAVH